MLHWIDWIIIGGYLLLALTIGLIVSRRAGKNIRSYFVSGRSLPWWLTGTSMVATSFAADTPLVITGWVRSEGISANWIWWSLAIGGMFQVFVFSRLWRRAEVLTDIELTERRYSGNSAAFLRGFKAIYFALAINVMTIAWVMVAMVKFFDVLFDVKPEIAVALCVALVAIYSILSGFWGVVLTDFIQFIIAMAGTILLSVFTVNHFGSLDQLVSQLDQNVLNFFPETNTEAGSFWKGPVWAIVIFLSVQWWANKNADGGGVVIQRMAASKNEKHALWATLWFNFANYALRPWPWILVALASLIIFPDLTDHELAYPKMIQKFMPSPFLGLMVTAFLAAFMSTIDSYTNLSSAYLVNDLYQRFIRPDASPTHYVWVSRMTSFGIILLGALLAYQVNSISQLFKFLLAFSSGIGSVYLLRWFWWRINAYSEITAMAASGLIAMTLHLFSKQLGQPTYPTILVITVLGSAAIWLPVTFLTRPTETARLIQFYKQVRPFGFWNPIALHCPQITKSRIKPLLLCWIAGSVWLIGLTLAIGKFLLLDYSDGWICLTLSTIGFICMILVEMSSHRPYSQAR
jgi:SSS family solute:Na+ symporter